LIRKHIFFVLIAALLLLHLSGELLMGNFTLFLQRASTSMSVWLFGLLGVPVQRDGFVLHLVNNVSVEVTRECSGIRSTMAMLLLSVMASYFYLKTTSRQVLFIAVAVVLTVVKNAARIVTLALLGAYVDPGFLYGRLHSEGAVIFFLIAMAFLAPLLLFLRHQEMAHNHPAVTIPPTPSVG
jgi:exosortase